MIYDYGQLKHKLSGKCQENEPLAAYTTWRVGGPADLFVEAVDEDDILHCLDFARRYNLPLAVIGNGSNILVLDGGVRGLVLHLGGKFRNIVVAGTEITAGAAVSLPRLSGEAAKHHLTGLEFAVGIPASLGGAVVMNAGIPGSSLSDVISTVQVVDRQGRVKCLSREELDFNYRRSNLDPGREIVLWATLVLQRGNAAEVRRIMEEQAQRRRTGQPINYLNAGSVFKNPPGYAAGYLVEKAGLKGANCGGAWVSNKHANFIVNDGSATAKDILSLIKTIQKEVEKRFNIQLEPEIHIIGEEN